jgi:thiamine kinase-like enzyme
MHDGNKNFPIIIDWEDAGLVNPFYDFVNTAIHWLKKETGVIVKDRFLVFAHSYHNKCDSINANWKTVLCKRFIEPLEWIEYSLKRSLGLECIDEQERQIGTDQVFYTIESEMIP